MVQKNRSEAEQDSLDCYTAGVVRLHRQLATIATYHRDMLESLQRIAQALRALHSTYRN